MGIYSYNYLMAITALEEKENRKIWVPIRGGNRGGWSLFDWQKVREMPYRDREMYLGNSAKIGILDKGGKWRRKDWYMKKDRFAQGQELNDMRSKVMRKDMERMNAALGYAEKEEEEEQLTPAQMQMLLKRVRGDKEDENAQDTMGLGFNKLKVQIRAKATDKTYNPHRLQGNQQPTNQSKIKLEEEHKRNEKKRQRSEDSEQRRRRKQKKRAKKQRKARQAKEQEEQQTQKILQKSRSREHRQKRSRSKSKERRKHKERRRSRSRSEDRQQRKDRFRRQNYSKGYDRSLRDSRD